MGGRLGEPFPLATLEGVPLLPRAIELIRAWGFEYKTVAFYWVKLNAKANPRDRFLYWSRLLDAGQSRTVFAGDARTSDAEG